MLRVFCVHRTPPQHQLPTDVDKVVDMLKADELPKKAVFCRCWRSGKVCERVDLLLFVCSGGVVVLGLVV